MIPIGRGAGKVEGPVTESALSWLSLQGHFEADGICDLTGHAWPCTTARRVAEIEAAARAEVIAEIRAGVEGLPIIGHGDTVFRAAVLALLPPTEPK